ncbi:MAG: SDR family oxidoreductase [Chlorobium sp.]
MPAIIKSTPEPSLGIVITGGTAGLGYSLASAFLSAGDRVVICGRNPERLQQAHNSLAQQGEVYAMRCDVSDPTDCRDLAEFAVGRLKTVDRWINNAGTAGEMKRPLWDLNAHDILQTSTTNLSGTLLQCAEAVKLMDRQPPSSKAVYHIFNMGFSFIGAALSRTSVPHKASKRGVAEVTHFLAREIKEAGKTSIGVHELSPGLVFTDLLLRDASPQAIKLFKVLAEPPDKVAARLVPIIRSIAGSNHHIRYQPLLMTFLKMVYGAPQLIGKKM